MEERVVVLRALSLVVFAAVAVAVFGIVVVVVKGVGGEGACFDGGAEGFRAHFAAGGGGLGGYEVMF